MLALENGVSVENIDKFRTKWYVLGIELYEGDLIIELEDCYQGGIDNRSIVLPEAILCSKNLIDDLCKINEQNQNEKKEKAKKQEEIQEAFELAEYKRLKKKFE